ncbi:MAG: hypothetical protein KDC48_11440, partial [Planctomycetes bacterium]|nr:hypothetical protein [Planctomycetota bacterium]
RKSTLLGSEDAAVYTKIGLGTSGRMLQLFDLALLSPKSEPTKWVLPDGEREALGGFVRQFLDPAPGDRDDVQVVSGRWLMVVGKPELLAGAERLIAANVEHREHAIEVEVRITKVASKLFEQVLQPHLVAVEKVEAKENAPRGGPGPELTMPPAEVVKARAGKSTQWQGLLGAKAAAGVVDVLIKEGSEAVSMPRLAVSPLRLATASSLNQTAYVRDFEVEQLGDKAVASPVVDVITDGIDGRVMVLYEPDGRIGLDCEVSVSEVLRPIPTAEVDLGVAGAPKGVVQLPRVRGVRLRQVAHLVNGEVAVVAAPRAEGGFLVAMIAVRTTR